MLDLLRDPAWQFVGAVLTVIGIVAAYVIYRLQRQAKELAFGLVSSRRLLSVADELTSRVTIQLDGTSVSNVHLLIYGLKNSGTRAVLPADFLRPLSISFPEGQVLSASIASERPENLEAEVSFAGSRVALNPLLLNVGDVVLLQVLLSAKAPSAAVDVRVVDVPVLAPIDVRPRRPPLLQSGLAILVAGLLLYAGVAHFFEMGNARHPVFFAGFAIFAFLFGVSTRLMERIGPSARRYIGEA